MAKAHDAGPNNVHKRVRRLVAGDRLHLTEGDYTKPIVLSSLSGTEENPILFTGTGAVLGAKLDYEKYQAQGNALAAAHEAGGEFPGLYYLADNAVLILRNCQWITIEKLKFDGGWPTAVYLENCQHITLRGLKINGGTFAIGATGVNTRHILVEDCDWVQDPSGNGWELCEALRAGRTIEKELDGNPSKLWRDVDWIEVHGDWTENGKRVDIKHDARAYDGDFFRAWSIAGYVVLRNNIIADAFNGIHFFNQVAESIIDSCSRNVLIEGNWFIRIRDNAIEPEHYAWNWTVRHNVIIDCYLPFSLQMARSGYFYIYGNVGWNVGKPGPEKDEHTRGQFFKFPTEHSADGPHYVFNNSWVLRAPLVKKMRFSNFIHVNNAIDYSDSDPDATAPYGANFRDIAPPGFQTGAALLFEAKHFTKAWQYLGIRFDGDVIHHPTFPDNVNAAGFHLGKASLGASPGFSDMTPGRPQGLKPLTHHPAVDLALLLPNGDSVTATQAQQHQVGAWQASGLIEIKDPMFWTYWPGRQDNSEVA